MNIYKNNSFIKVIIYILFVVTSLFSCDLSKSQNKENISNDIQEDTVKYLIIKGKITESLKKLDLNPKVIIDTTTNKQELFVHVHYYPKYFIDDESNKLIISIVIYELYNYFKNYESVTFKITMSDFKGEFDILGYSSENIYDIYMESKKNQQFVKFSKYALKNIPADDLLKLNWILEDLKECIEEFSFKGSFWDFLYKYSNNCEDKKMQEQFKLLVKGAGFDKFEIDQDVLKYYLEACK